MKIAFFGDPAHERRFTTSFGAGTQFAVVPTNASYEDMARGFADAEILVTLRLQKDMPPVPDLKLLQLPAAGYDGIDFGRLPSACIVCNAYEHEVPIAEYVLLAMLDSVIGYSEMTARFVAAAWPQQYAKRVIHGEVWSRTVGVLGCGRIGREVAKRARAFGMRVIGLGRAAGPKPDFLDWYGAAADLDEFLGQCDFIVVACPLTAQTRGMIASAQFERMRSEAWLINVSRAEIVDQDSLYEALKERRIRGATIDVWYAYPSPSARSPQPARHPISELPNVRSTPHSSALTEAMWTRRFAVVADNIRRFLNAEPLINVVRGPVNQGQRRGNTGSTS